MTRILFLSSLLLSVCLVTPELATQADPKQSASEPVTGRWRADAKDSSPDRLYFDLRFDDREDRHQVGTAIARDAFTGLPPELSKTGPIGFELRRDAGTTRFEGEFRDGWGSGRFSFAADPAFASMMQQRGMKRRGEGREAERMFAFAIHDVSRAFIQQIEQQGHTGLTGDQLLAFRIHGVTPEFVAEMKKLGYELSSDQLVAFRIHRVTPELVAQMKQAGYTSLSGDDLVAGRIHGVTPEFVNGLAELGYKKVEFDDLVAMRIHRVTPEFIRELKALGYSDVPVDTLVAMRIHRVDAEFIKEVRADGYTDLTPRELVDFSIHGRRWMRRKR